MRHKQCAVWTGIMILLLAGAISSCRPRTAEPTPTSTKPLTCEQQSEQGLRELDGHPEFKDLMYVENQVILIGKPDAVAQVAERVELRTLDFEPISLSDGREIRLYDTNNQSVQLATCKVNELEPEFGVWADPNYHLSPAGWIGGGSPWTQNGNWVGNPGGGYTTTQALNFDSQWAFGPQGISLVDNNGNRLGQETGTGTRIVILDTSPFEDAGWTGGRCDGCSIQELTANAPAFDAVTMTLNVWHQIDLIPAPSCPGYDRNDAGRRTLEGQDISNHGLFVAGLAHAVAPDSEIYLVRVLEPDGCGTLYQIMQGIDMAAREILRDKETLRGTIINLSLGVHSTDQNPRFGLSSEIKTFESILREVSDRGATIVAAAGNDSYDTKAPRTMELPAGYDFVFGVAASNSERTRGCFSNAGDVAAPGGDGERGEKAECEIPACSDANTDPCLISMVYKPQPGYAYWVGTSFAAPLYSGMQALLYQRGVPSPISPSALGAHNCSSPDATLPNGIANWAKLYGVTCP